jgi:hypothetical protein
MTDFEQSVVKYLSLIAQELVRITEAIQDNSFTHTPKESYEAGDKMAQDYLTSFEKAQEKFGKPLDDTRPTFAADALEVPSEPKITLEK